VIFNVRTRHEMWACVAPADTFRALIDAQIALGGSFFLTYHRHASTSQVESCYPRFREFLDLKKRYDPDEIFSSDWYCALPGCIRAECGDVVTGSSRVT
jgi:hypothetical protein